MSAAIESVKLVHGESIFCDFGSIGSYLIWVSISSRYRKETSKSTNHRSKLGLEGSTDFQFLRVFIGKKKFLLVDGVWYVYLLNTQLGQKKNWNFFSTKISNIRQNFARRRKRFARKPKVFWFPSGNDEKNEFSRRKILLQMFLWTRRMQFRQPCKKVLQNSRKSLTEGRNFFAQCQKMLEKIQFFFKKNSLKFFPYET